MRRGRESHRLDLGIEDILQKLVVGNINIDEAKRKLSTLNIERIADLASLDINRNLRTGVPEAIFAEGKRPEDVAKLALRAARKSGYALVTRAGKNHVKKLRVELPREFELDHNERAGMIVVKRRGHVFKRVGRIGLLAAGTADVPIAEEARVSAEVMGCEVIKAYDVGIAGIHRLFDPLKRMLGDGAAAIVAVAGMEGALPSVVAGLVDIPVIGVPTSFGYGVGVGGIGALMTMLQSCSPKLAVVNIDNGFGAGVFAALIARQSAKGAKLG